MIKAQIAHVSIGVAPTMNVLKVFLGFSEKSEYSRQNEFLLCPFEAI